MNLRLHQRLRIVRIALIMALARHAKSAKLSPKCQIGNIIIDYKQGIMFRKDMEYCLVEFREQNPERPIVQSASMFGENLVHTPLFVPDFG